MESDAVIVDSRERKKIFIDSMVDMIYINSVRRRILSYNQRVCNILQQLGKSWGRVFAGW